MYDKETLTKIRRKVRHLYFEEHLTKSQIARKLSVSRLFVRKWTKDPSIPVDADRRGWPLGKKRTRTDQEELRIVNLRKELEKGVFFYGPDTILDEYTKRYPEAPCLSRSFVTRVITKHFPMSRRGTLKAVKEQNYPIEAISSLGEIQEEADFLGKKYIQGRSAPLHFFTRVYKNPFTLRLIKRVPDEGSETIMDTFTEDWKAYPVPDVLSIDNGFGFTASGRSPRVISPCIQYFLQVGATPLFIAPKKPWMNGSVEGTHSVFARKVWNRIDFQNVEEVDETVLRFEDAYRRYTTSQRLYTVTHRKSYLARRCIRTLPGKMSFKNPFSLKTACLFISSAWCRNMTMREKRFPQSGFLKSLLNWINHLSTRTSWSNSMSTKDILVFMWNPTMRTYVWQRKGNFLSNLPRRGGKVHLRLNT